MSPTQENEPTQQPNIKRTHLFSKMIRSRWIWLVIVVCIAAAAYKIFLMQTASQAVARAKAQNDAQRPLPVKAVAAIKADMDVNLRGLGTVIPVNTITVRSQVSGQLLRVHFKEGQIVKQGELLAEIDPRPFEVQLMQAEGQLARDEIAVKECRERPDTLQAAAVTGFHRRAAGAHPRIAGAAIRGSCKKRTRGRSPTQNCNSPIRELLHRYRGVSVCDWWTRGI